MTLSVGDRSYTKSRHKESYLQKEEGKGLQILFVNGHIQILI